MLLHSQTDCGTPRFSMFQQRWEGLVEQGQAFWLWSTSEMTQVLKCRLLSEVFSVNGGRYIWCIYVHVCMYFISREDVGFPLVIVHVLIT